MSSRSAASSVHAVENGEAALEYLQSGAQVDVLFTDINMPGEIDGAELANGCAQSAPGTAGRLRLRPLHRWRPHAGWYRARCFWRNLTIRSKPARCSIG